SASTIVAMFNPSRLTVSRSVQWQNQEAAKRDNPEMQFTGGEPASLTVDLLFDTYDTPEPESAKKSVKAVYTDKLLHLTTVEEHGDKHRPPVCRLQWGNQGVFFQGVLTQLETSFTLFTQAGVPVRATNRCSFKQWTANTADLQKQNLMSSDVAKVWTVKRGQSLAAIAAVEYGDARAWRVIAEANGIDNPLALEPGTRLMLPARRVAWAPEALP
ncbi:MAG: LysM domain, partial [Rhizobacter sp.]|nr:LysM domain [Rhizobacter sp.]